MKAEDVERVLAWLRAASTSLLAGYTICYPPWLLAFVEEVGTKIEPLPTMTADNMYQTVTPPKTRVYVKLRGGTEVEL